MSESIIIARHRLACDLCGGILHEGEKCRMIRDDFQRNIVRFEHLRCPGSPAVTVESNSPKSPKDIHYHNKPCYA